MAARLRQGAGRLLPRLRRRAGPHADQREVEPPGRDAVAAQGRPPLRPAALQRRAAGRRRRQLVPLHVRGGNARLRRQQADHLRQLHAGDDAATGDHAAHAGALLPAALRLPVHGLHGGRVPQAPASRARVRRRRQEVRDLHGTRRRPQPRPPDPLPHVPRLARGPLARRLRLRARRGLAGLQREGPQEVGLRAGHPLHRLGGGGAPAPGGGGRAQRDRYEPGTGP